MQLLLLGGTGFLGRGIAAAGIAAGHEVVCLARGSGPVADGTRLIQVDRDREDGLTVAGVADLFWGAIIDLTVHPLHARRAVRHLRAGHYVCVSTSSVYAHNDAPERTESTPTLSALPADYMREVADYGSAKVAVEAAYGDLESTTIIRPALIGGDGDVTGRSGYYPWRFAHPVGARVAVPELAFPTALIDVKDLARWIIHCADQRIRGVFNAAGHTSDLATVVRLSREIARSEAVPAEMGADLLAAHGVQPWMGPRSLPLWIPDPNWRYVATLDSAAAVAQGLVRRPLMETLRAALEFEHGRGGPRGAGLSDAEERDLLAGVSGREFWA